MPLDWHALDAHGSTLPDGTLETLAKRNGFVLGPIGQRDHLTGSGAIDLRPIMQKHVNLFDQALNPVS